MHNDFDIASKEYDNIFTFSNIGKAQRKRVHKYLNSAISKKKLSILELNCGTGEDAIHFANLGHNVIATDISEGMINVAKSKSYSSNLTFLTQDINTITTQTFGEKFDLIFSNFGGLNCLSKKQLNTFIKTSANLLNIGGKLILVIMPKQCIWERIYFSIKGDIKKAKRRLTNNSVLANVDGVKVATWYYNPEDIINLAQTAYQQKNVKPIGITIPPSYLENSFLSKKPFLNFLVALEKVIGISFLAKYADHFLIELEKK